MHVPDRKIDAARSKDYRNRQQRGDIDNGRSKKQSGETSDCAFEIDHAEPHATWCNDNIV